jgi:hypothetical protein
VAPIQPDSGSALLDSGDWEGARTAFENDLERGETKGRMIMYRLEGDIVAEEGEAYYVGPGHTGEVGLPGTQVIEFSPADEYDQTLAVVASNLQAASAGE